MKIELENTEKMVWLNDVQCRVWEGHTDSGIPVVCFIERIRVPDGRPDEEHRLDLTPIIDTPASDDPAR